MSDSPPQKPRTRVRKKALLSFTKLTAPKPVTKQMRLLADGKVGKLSTAQRLTTAAIERMTCDANGFLNALRTVNPTDCFVYGTPKSTAAERIVTVRQHEEDGQRDQGQDDEGNAGPGQDGRDEFPRFVREAPGNFRYDVLDGVTEDGNVEDRHGIHPVGIEDICNRYAGRKK